jgi:hypothetical protein
MTRIQYLAVTLAAYALVVGGLFMLFGPWAFVGTGVVLLAYVLFLVDVKE